jgi:hypothetical protein
MVWFYPADRPGAVGRVSGDATPSTSRERLVALADPGLEVGSLGRLFLVSVGR